MKNNKRLSVVILFLSMLIIVGAGHGIGLLIFIELLLIPDLISYLIEGRNSFEDVIVISGIVVFFGQLFLTVSFFKKSRAQVLYQFTGVITILIGFVMLTYPLDTSNQRLSFYSGIPLLVFISILWVRYIIQFKKGLH
jgi:hypothetical protein